MSRSQRRSDPAIAITRLERRHKRLKEQVAQFEARRSLTPPEQTELSQLKKAKLATKDALHRMRH